MKQINIGALRRATDGARLSAANDLVQRTLARHGLAGPVGAGETSLNPGMPSLQDLLAKISSAQKGNGAGAPELPDGAAFLDDTFSCPAGSRRFRTYIPAKATEGATGAILMLHGCTQSPEDFAAGTGMNALADRYGFVVIYPAQSRGENAQSCWNWFSRGDQRRGRGEPAILATLTQQVCAEHNVGPEVTFVAGLSAGAAMATILGETYPDVFAGVGAHSGLPFGSAKDVPSAFAAMAGNALDAPRVAQSGNTARTIVFHGTADNTVHPSNGDSIARRARDQHLCDTLETSVLGDAGGRRYTRTLSCDADGTALVELWAVEGQGHAWSGGNPLGSYTDPKGPDASAEMIRFFFESAGGKS